MRTDKVKWTELITGILILCNISAGRWAIAILFPVWFIAHCISRLSHLSLIRLTVGDAYYYFTLVINILGLVMGFLMLFNPLAAMSGSIVFSDPLQPYLQFIFRQTYLSAILINQSPYALCIFFIFYVFSIM